MEIRARLLPSRIYSRWKWAVRGGLLPVPCLTLLTALPLPYLMELALPPQSALASVAALEFADQP